MAGTIWHARKLEVLLRDHLAGYYRFLGRVCFAVNEKRSLSQGRLGQDEIWIQLAPSCAGGLSTLLAFASIKKYDGEVVESGDSLEQQNTFTQQTGCAVDKGDTIG